MRLRDRREWRFNAVLTGILVVVLALLANLLARDHLRWRVDLSEEGHLAADPVAERMLGALEDVLAVQVFFTGELQHGPVQVAKSRMIDQLRVLEDQAGGRMQVVYGDPNTSSEVRLEAESYGIEPVPLRAIQGTSELTQEVWLGMVLRYRGREAVLPFVLPQTLQYGFLSELNRLVREREVSVGFVSGSHPFAADPGPPVFGEAIALLGTQYRVRELVRLADGMPVPEDVAVLVVARPDTLHPRELFEIDQYLQRGGRALVLAERLRVDLDRYEARLVDPGIDPLLDAWGVALTDELVWDTEANWLRIEGAGRTQFPFWVNVGEAGMERSVPATGKLPGADFFWVHGVFPTREVPGVTSLGLVRSSDSSWLVAPEDALPDASTSLNARAVELLATEPGQPRTLALSVAGRLPSPFAPGGARAGAPAIRNALEDDLWLQRVRAALEAGREPPPRPGGTTDEPVLSAAAPAQVVVVGDADWIQDGRFFTERNRVLFQSLVDWLALEDDLVALRARLPKDRRIRDLAAEERERRGLAPLVSSGTLSVEDADPALAAEAEAAASRARRLFTAAATGGSLLLALGVVLGGRALLVGRAFLVGRVRP